MVKFKTIGKKNPQDLLAQEKFYAQAVSDGRLDLKALAQLAARQSTVSRADCYAVLISLSELVTYHLADGKIVDLGDLGSFRMSLSSEGVETSEELSASAIKKAKILFSPGSDLKAMLKTVKYTKVSA
ncbi:HU family DNA-binding protein [Formosa sp. S-31]|uniref:HU family DNA-binding protein n=1 Tax=Formosa sp. S-31 TaxID=2790949 RepID=UPI003EBBE5DF